MKNTKPKKLKTVNGKTLIVAVDVGKTRHFGYFRTPGGQDVKPFAFYNLQQSFQGFWESIISYKREQGLEEIVIGFESSGPYAKPLLCFLANKPVKLVQVNPMHTKRIKELTGNSPNKTDRKDPRVIADIISLGHALTVVIPEGSAAELRRLTQARERATKHRTAIVNQLHHLVFLVFPELLQIMKKIRSKITLCLLEHCPGPENIMALGREPLMTLLKSQGRGKLKADLGEKLFQAAQNSIGIREGRKSILVEIKHLVSKIKRENRFIEELERQMSQHLKDIPYSKSILSIKGIGEITLSGLIGEVGDFRQFRTIPEIMKLAGLDLYEVSSGKQKGKLRISKRGRSLLRRLLYFIALNSIRSNGIMHERYQAMLARGMHKVKAIVALSRKMLRIIFALSRSNTVYVENYNQGVYLNQAV